MIELAAISFVAALFLAGVVVLREPRLLLPIVVLGLPIEYFATVTLDDFGGSGVAGAVRALLVPGKAAMLATVVVAIVRSRNNLSQLLPDSAVLLPIVVLMSVMLIGLGWSDSLLPPNSLLILPMYVAFVFAAPTLIEDRRDFERIWGAMFAIASVLAMIAVVQRFGVFNWRGILIQSDEVSYRSNATFGDPNILARYFAVVIPLAMPAIASLGIFQFLWVWNDLLVALVFLGGTSPVMTYQISNMVTSLGAGWQLLTASAFLSMLLPMIVFFGLQRYFVRGMLAGAVKG